MTARKTKIVPTIGPASAPPEMLHKLLLSGVDVVRLNFSHGDYDLYASVIRTIRAWDRENGTHTAVLADLQGPKLRIGEMSNGAIELKEGEELVITTEPVKGR